jgi:hypothetical protein
MKNGRLIIFFVPPEKRITGGLISIFSICESSRAYSDIHKAHVFMSVYPGHNSYKKNDLFKNDETVYSFDEIIKLFPNPEYVQIHLPEYASQEVFNKLKPYRDYLKSIPELSINILDQNVLLMPTPVDAAQWFLLTPTVTQTTAHDIYSTQELADKYAFPSHHLSAFVDAKQYTYRKFDEKENIILLSNDEHEERDNIVQLLTEKFPDYQLITVKDMKYEYYKDLMSRSKFAVTFGEGFDGYYVEAFFTGGLTFSVYNDDFFPDKEFSTFENVYSSYKVMLKKIEQDINRLNKDKELYQKISKENLDKINELYTHESYMNKLKEFYLQNYTYLPSKNSKEYLIAEILNTKNSLIQQGEVLIDKYQKDINDLITDKKDLIEEVKDREIIISDMSSSVSWRVTKPLRNTKSRIKKGSN